jgi:hypothetical protein
VVANEDPGKLINEEYSTFTDCDLVCLDIENSPKRNRTVDGIAARNSPKASSYDRFDTYDSGDSGDEERIIRARQSQRAVDFDEGTGDVLSIKLVSEFIFFYCLQ